MNKAVKGALAIAAAVVLTVGGAGSLAYWQTTQTTSAAQFTTGSLALAAVDDATWKLNGTEITDPSTVTLIPGSVVQFTQSFTPTITGTGMLVTATLSGAVPSISGSEATSEWSTNFNLTGAGIDRRSATVWALTQSGAPVTVAFTLVVPTGLTDTMGETLDLTAITVTLTQVSMLPTDGYPCAC